jgi:predicted transposase/invertase (TIGR01784 family)
MNEGVSALVAIVKEDSKQYGLELLELRNDFVFKSFFTDERNNRLLLHFVNSILGGSIKSLRLTDPTNTKKYSADKMSIMDLRATTELGEQINIEMQLERHTAFNERMLYYWAKLYSSQMKSSDSYGQLKKVIQIIISDFKMLPIRDIHSKFQLIEPMTGIVFSKHLEIHVIQLPKEQEKSLNDMNDLEKWLVFFKGNQDRKEEISMESSAFKEAFEEIRKLSMDPDTVQLAISREIALRDHIQRLEDAEKIGMELGLKRGMQQGREEGKTEGKAEGEKNAKIDVVLKLHGNSSPISFIAEITGFSIEEINSIIKSRS